jgi:hypothetical protein
MNRLVFAALLLAACSGESSGTSSGGAGGSAPTGGGGEGGTGGAACACDCEPTAPSTHPIAYCEDPAHDGDACCLLDGEIGTCSQGACTTAIPWDGSPYLGVGYDGSPCSAQGAYYLSPDETPRLLSLAIVVPADGFITGATVVHVVADAADVCDMSARTVLVSKPVPAGAPFSPPVHEALVFSLSELSNAQPYALPDAQVASAVQVTRPLADVMQVHAGDVVHLATVRDATDVCPLECDAPSGSVTYLCTDVDEWKGCAPRAMTAVAWLDFAPE